MTTTLQLDDQLYERTREAASAQGKSVDEFVGDALLKALSNNSVRRTVRNGLPVMAFDDNVPAVDVDKARRIIEDGCNAFARCKSQRSQTRDIRSTRGIQRIERR